MNRIPVTKLLVVLAMLLSIAGGPAIAAWTGCPGCAKVCMKHCGCKMCCCAGMEKGSAQEKPAPVQQPVGEEIAAAVLTAPFSLLFQCAPAEAKRAPRELFADGHAPEPLAASCVWLI